MGMVSRTKSRAIDWKDALLALHERMRPHFAQPESWWMAGRYVYALMLPMKRCNTWQMAEAVGDCTPHNFQQFLKAGVWSAEGLRDGVAAYVYEELGEPDGVLVLDESGTPKQGKMSAGVGRQYIGCTGQVENAQVAVFAAYVTRKGAALTDRALYLPKEWTDDPARCRKAHVPDDVDFATKPELGRRMVQRALAKAAPFRWVAGDSVYGRDADLRVYLERQEVPYVLGVAADFRVWRGDKNQRVDTIPASVPPEAWHRRSAGEGTRGPRWFDWAVMRVQGSPRDGWYRWVLVRRTVDGARTDYYMVAAPAGTTEEEMVRVAGARWAIEVCFELGKQEVGLLDCEVRSWHAWHRHVTLAMEALAFLVVTRHAENPREPAQKGAPQASKEGHGMAEYLKKRGLRA